MEIVSGLFKELWKVWTEMFDLLMENIPRFSVLLLWLLSGLIILPCVFVAGTFYTKWSEWGEKL